MKVYVTKYALTTGIEVVEVKPPEENEEPQYVYTKGFVQQFIMGKTAFLTYKEAAIAAREMRDKKRASLKKQLTRLNELIFPTNMPENLKESR